jgi:hypothetical protein
LKTDSALQSSFSIPVFSYSIFTAERKFPSVRHAAAFSARRSCPVCPQARFYSFLLAGIPICLQAWLRPFLNAMPAQRLIRY